MIEFDKVTKHLGDKNVLDELSFKVEKGETFVIVGRSGVGKSVTLKHMVRLMRPDSGEVRVEGEDIGKAGGEELDRIREKFGYLFQGGALLAWLSVFENVALPLRERTNMGEEEITERVMTVLKLVQLENDGQKNPSEISGGMRKRAGLARAIVRKPQIVLYDEPTSGLDPVTARAIDALIESLRKEIGVTSIVVTHDLHSALTIGTRIAVLQGGKIVELSTPERFISSTNPEVKDFLSSQFITRDGPWERKTK